MRNQSTIKGSQQIQKEEKEGGRDRGEKKEEKGEGEERGRGGAEKERGVEKWGRMRFNLHKTGVPDRENRGDIWEDDGWVSSRIDEKHKSSE